MTTILDRNAGESVRSTEEIPEPSVSIEWVTPEQAREWLEHNDRNRPLSTAAIARKRAEIGENWKLTPDAIAFNTLGELDNGQHRLKLVAEGTEPRQFIIVRNLPPENWDVTDKGKVRSFGDTLHRRGEKNTAALAAALRTLHRYERTGEMVINSGGMVIPEDELLRFLTHHGDLRVAVREARSAIKTEFLATSASAVLFYCFWKASTWQDAQEFFRLIREPEGLQDGDAIIALKRRLDEDLSARARNSYSKRLDEVERRALFIIAFNKWIVGERVRLLTWRPGGARPERFPLVRGYEPLARFL